MEKQKIKVNYSGSGIKTLSILGTFLLFIAVIYALIDVLIFLCSGISIYKIEIFGEVVKTVINISLHFPIAIFVAGVICKILSALLKSLLYKRALLEEQYDFYEEKRKYLVGANVENEEKE
jgi:hypothetical protein